MSELQSADMVEKLKDNFDEMVVYKDLKKSNFITSFKMPSFMRDWVLKRFQDDDGEIDVDGATAFIREFIPKKEDWKSIKNRIVNYQEQMKFLVVICTSTRPPMHGLSMKRLYVNCPNFICTIVCVPISPWLLGE